MRLRHALIAAVALIAIGAHAVPSTARAQGGTANFNCAMLSGSPYLCLKNESGAMIIAVQALHGNIFNPSSWITVPGGGIMPGGAAVVRFPVFSGGPIQTIFVRTSDGQSHIVPNVDVVHTTSVTIRW